MRFLSKSFRFLFTVYVGGSKLMKILNLYKTTLLCRINVLLLYHKKIIQHEVKNFSSNLTQKFVLMTFFT